MLRTGDRVIYKSTGIKGKVVGYYLDYHDIVLIEWDDAGGRTFLACVDDTEEIGVLDQLAEI